MARKVKGAPKRYFFFRQNNSLGGIDGEGSWDIWKPPKGW